MKPLTLMIANRAGLPKRTQTYVFFQIDKAGIQEFRAALNNLLPLITTTTQVQNDRQRIAQHKQQCAGRKCACPPLTMSGVNISFSHKGLVQVRPAAEHLIVKLSL